MKKEKKSKVKVECPVVTHADNTLTKKLLQRQINNYACHNANPEKYMSKTVPISLVHKIAMALKNENKLTADNLELAFVMDFKDQNEKRIEAIKAKLNNL